MADTKNNSPVLNLALVLAIAGFAALVIYSNHFRKSQHDIIKASQSQTVSAERDSNAAPTPMPDGRSTFTLAASSKNPLEGATHPVKQPVIGTNTTPEVPETDSQLKIILERQARDLRAEKASQGIRPEDKRALSLSEKEIQELEKSGRMIY